MTGVQTCALPICLSGDLREIWPRIGPSHIGTQDTVNYLMERTLMRPRDLLKFVNHAIAVAINRGHDAIDENDLRLAERNYSEDLLLTTVYEIQDTQPRFAEILYEFDSLSHTLPFEDVEAILTEAGLPVSEVEAAIELLLWFGFMGVRTPASEQPRYAYQIQWNMRRLLQPLERGDASLVIHPAFRAALQTSDP